MTTAILPAATPTANGAVSLSAVRKLAIAAGACYLITHVTSVPAAILYRPILNRADYIPGAGPDTRVLWAALLEVHCTLSIVGTAASLFPVVKREHESDRRNYRVECSPFLKADIFYDQAQSVWVPDWILD